MPSPEPAATERRPRLLHLIPSLEIGGAERMLLRLITHEAAAPFDHQVLTLLSGGALAPRFSAAGIGLHAISMRRGVPTPAAALRLGRLVRRLAPDLLVGWLYHGNVAASFTAVLGRPRGRRLPVVWNVRHSPDDLAAERPLTALLIRLGARWSSRVEAVVYNSQTSARLHLELGYSAERTEVLPNGFDTELYRPSAEARSRLRSLLGLGEEAVLVGRIGRYHAMKGFELFLEAAAPLVRENSPAHLVLAGRGVDGNNPTLAAAVEAQGLAGRVHLLGPRDDLEGLLPGLDVMCSSSLYG
ncbi:MAG: glycosyltransferase, partial [Acidobacteria bacterium]|nr:glycosyltransferase [Acidobacteriota bacterium]